MEKMAESGGLPDIKGELSKDNANRLGSCASGSDCKKSAGSRLLSGNMKKKKKNMDTEQGSLEEYDFCEICDQPSPTIRKECCVKAKHYGTIERRLSTFTTFNPNGKSNRNILELAGAGFINNNHINQISCAFCEFTVEIGKDHIDIFSAHKVTNPSCDFFKAQYACELVDSSVSPCPQERAMDEDQTSVDEMSLVTYRSGDNPGYEVWRENIDDDINEAYRSLCKQRLKKEMRRVASSVTKSFPQKLLADKMHCHRSRKQTFQRYHCFGNPSAKLLASNGFYLRQANNVLLLSCTFCGLTCNYSKEMGASPEFISTLYRDHMRNDCNLLKGTTLASAFNIPDVLDDITWASGKALKTQAASLQSDTSPNNLGLGINMQQAKYPSLAVTERRARTFLTYIADTIKHVDDLVASGYFYEGRGDAVICFSCGLSTSNFKLNEDVWTRHVRTSPDCPFLSLEKGQDYVDRVIEQHGIHRSSQNETIVVNNPTIKMLRPRWDSIPVQTALQMGLERTAVKTVIINRIKRGEHDYRSSAEVVRAVADLKVPSSALEHQQEELFVFPKVISPPKPRSIDENSDVDDEDNQRGGHTEMYIEEDHQEINTQKEAFPDEPPADEDIESAASQIKNRLTCKICLSGIVGIVFLPCGHLVCCTVCSAAMEKCPICRKTVHGTIKANF